MFEGKNVITILARLIVKLFNAVRSGNIINFLYRLKKLRKSKKIPKSDITLIIVAHILAPLPLVLKCSCSCSILNLSTLHTTTDLFLPSLLPTQSSPLPDRPCLPNNCLVITRPIGKCECSAANCCCCFHSITLCSVLLHSTVRVLKVWGSKMNSSPRSNK